MALSKSTTQEITVLEDGQLQVKDITRIIEDGVVISAQNHRRVVVPGQEIPDSDTRVKQAVDTFHDAATISNYQTKLAAQRVKDVAPELTNPETL
jgi:archaellum component FlaF (FlaF/FlaG flagellin family)